MLNIDQNPNVHRHEPKVKQLVLEIPYGVSHLRRSFEQKKNYSVQEAQNFLLLAQQKIPKPNPYFIGQEIPQVINHIDSGFFASVYSFSSSTGTWVLKTGVQYSPIRSYFHPNSQEFADWYQYTLDLQRRTFGDYLPFLIPEPQTVLHLSGERRETTAIFQPFISDTIPSKDIKSLSYKEKQGLKTEIETFYEIYKHVRKGFGFTPDFELGPDFLRGRAHLVIKRYYDSPHLVLLDNALFDRQSPMPIVYQLNKLAGILTMKSMMIKLRM